MRPIITVLMLLLSSTCLFASDKSLTIVGDFQAKPKNWLNTDNQPVGIMIDLLEEVSLRTGIQFKYELYPWKRAYALSEAGKGAIIGFSKTSERQKYWDYSIPMYNDELVFVTTKEKLFNYTDLESIANKRLAIKNGASYGDDFEKAKTQGLFNVIETTNRASQLRMLALDRVDVVLVSPGRLALETEIARNDWLKQHRDEFIILEPAYKLDPNFLGIPKSMKKSYLLPLIDQALLDIKEDGTHQKIIDRNIQKVINGLSRK